MQKVCQVWIRLWLEGESSVVLVGGDFLLVEKGELKMENEELMEIVKGLDKDCKWEKETRWGR